MTVIRGLAVGLLLFATSGTESQAASMRRPVVWQRVWVATDAPSVPVPARPIRPAPHTSGSGGTITGLRAVPLEPSTRSGGTNVQRVVPEPIPMPRFVPIYAPEPSPYGPTFPGTVAAGGGGYQYDALVNLGEGPYPASESLTSGVAQPWYLSPVVGRVFGGVPDEQQRAAFTQSVLDRVGQVFARSGVPVSLTADPNASAPHTLSVVSGAVYSASPDAVGIADMGGHGFSFIDKFEMAASVDELERAVAHNVAHELMHTFEVGHHDDSGAFLDAPVTDWAALIDPNASFSQAAAEELLSQNFRERYAPEIFLWAQHLSAVQPSPVPEPATIVLWSLVGAGVVAVRYRRRRATA